MKRQESNIDGRKQEGQKKCKMVRGVEGKEEEGRKKNGGSEAAVVVAVENLMAWPREEWAWLRGGTDEQMSWGSLWSPFWDVDFVDKAYAALFSDVAWDDDIWNLKTITEIPKP